MFFTYETDIACLTPMHQEKIAELLYECFLSSSQLAKYDRVVIYQAAGTIQGICLLKFGPYSVISDNQSVTLSCLCTRRTHRKRGIASAILEYVTTEHKNLHLYAKVERNASYDTCKSLLRRAGFVVEDEEYYQPSDIKSKIESVIESKNESVIESKAPLPPENTQHNMTSSEPDIKTQSNRIHLATTMSRTPDIRS